ncbi:MAG: hypothetical protein BGO28_04020 [Alphaproteobacteria bacterium 43-37]|nr:MAG: hypothetical protein BGO28_04020 [Alphaproteobacteria bacterium 43-37]
MRGSRLFMAPAFARVTGKSARVTGKSTGMVVEGREWHERAWIARQRFYLPFFLSIQLLE